MLVLLGAVTLPAHAEAQEPPLARWLARFPLPPDQIRREVVELVTRRLPRLQVAATADEWRVESARLRERVLGEVILRGAARDWAANPVQCQTLDRLDAGPGFTRHRLRIEVLPGLWIGGLWYLPDPPRGRGPGVLHVNGHEPRGLSTPYKQRLSIELARRGLTVLDLEWFGMGQLATPGFSHYRLNQLDLCGTSGVAPFYLALRRGLDALAARPEVDPTRLAVTGLSGGGWQSILIAALDPRVALAHPVAGYGPVAANVAFDDFGDSEQAPSDLAGLADYTHLTALVAPRRLLLTYNAADDCCFRADHTLPPLVAAAEPVYRLLGAADRLHTHVNDDPGTHNYQRDNREAFYAALAEAFFPGDHPFARREAPGDDPPPLDAAAVIPLPETNLDFHRLAQRLADDAQRRRADRPASARECSADRRRRLAELVRIEGSQPSVVLLDQQQQAGLSAAWYRLHDPAGSTTVLVRISPERPSGLALILAGDDPAWTLAAVSQALARNQAVAVVHLFSLGDAAVHGPDPPVTYALALDTVGRRPLGLLVDQLLAAERWLRAESPELPMVLVTSGPRTGLVAQVARALEPGRFAGHQALVPLARLRQVIDDDLTAEAGVDLFCFGLLEEFELDELERLATKDVP